MKKLIVTLAAFLLAAQLNAPARAQETKQPAFTLHSRVTRNMDDGSQRKLKEVRYVSSDGSFRAVHINEDGAPFTERVFQPGRGLFNVHHVLRMIAQNRSNSPETASTTPPPTVEQLRASPHFVRTEEVLGRTTYVHRIKNEKTGAPEVDYYFTPELGRMPLKTVDYLMGKVSSVTDPTSITFGEPDAAQLKLPDYEFVERMPISGGVLNGKATHKPLPSYPAEARAARAQGVVTVMIIVNEDGSVKLARAGFGHELLRPAAVEAALKARFAPTRLDGQPIKVAGVITYNFVLR